MGGRFTVKGTAILEEPTSPPRATAAVDFDALLEAEQGGLLRLARRLVWDGEEARDLVQATLADACEKRHTLRDVKAGPAWLRSILVSPAMGHLRRRRLWTLVREALDFGPSPEEHFAGAERWRTFGRALRTLPAPAYGLPPHLVEKLGVPRELAQRIQDLSFESNEALIPLEADLKRAQLRLERLLRASTVDESGILKQSEEVGRAETAVRRNRLTLMVQIKKLLGPELWQKLEAEMGPMRVEKRLKILLGPPGEEAEPRPGVMPLPRKP